MSMYRKKPVVVEAMLLTSTNAREIAAWAADHGDNGMAVVGTSLSIRTLEGVMRAPVGSYIIRGVQGEFYPCEPNIFKQTYELVTQ